MNIENNSQGNQDLNSNLILLANVACEHQLLQRVFLELQSLKEYAIYYRSNENQKQIVKNNQNLYSTSSNKPRLP